MTAVAWDPPVARPTPGALPVLDSEQAVDVYLVWDRVTDQARHHHPGLAGARALETHLPVMLQFAPGHSLQSWCQPERSEPPAYARSLLQALAPSLALAPDSRIHCGILAAARVDLLLAAVADGVLLRFQLGAPCRVRQRGVQRKPLPAPASAYPERSRLHTLGLIDDGCCLAHQDFWSADANGRPHSRVLALWDQDPAAAASPAGPWRRYTQGPAGKPVGYGAELLAEEIGPVLASSPQQQRGEVAEHDVYKRLERAHWGARDHTHGARVMHLLAGPLPVELRAAGASLTQPAAPPTQADQLPVIFVQLPAQTVADTSGDSLPMHVVDGARYIASHTARRAGPGRPWHTTINISVGSIAGPHDGSSMADLALAELASLANVDVVVAAGNTADRQGVHAERSIGAGRLGKFLVRVPPDTGRDSFVEFWLPTDQVGADSFSVQVRPPAALGCPPSAPQQVGTMTTLRGPEGVLAAAVLPRQVAQGLHGTMLLLAIAPTTRRQGEQRPLSPAGIWTVEISLAGKAKATVHAWVERDDVIIGARRPQRTRFEQDSADTDGASYITDTHTLASLAHAEGIAVAGATVLSSGAMARYSGQGPRRTEASTAIPTLPNWFAPSERSPTLRGLAVPGFYSGSRDVINGTSAAAPQVGRHLAEAALASKPYISQPDQGGQVLPQDQSGNSRRLRSPADPLLGRRQRQQPVPQGAKLVPRPPGRWA